MPTTTTTITTTNSQYVLDGAKYRYGSIMGLTQDDGDNTVDIIYSTKPDQESVSASNPEQDKKKENGLTREKEDKQDLYHY